MKVWSRTSLEKKISFIITVGFSVAAVFVAVYYCYFEKDQLERLLVKQARQTFSQVQVARHWNAEHGGLYAMLRPGEKANPYLYKVGPAQPGVSDVEPEIEDTMGRRLALINPALMTRELSEESRQHSRVHFHLTSLKLINPKNVPDPFEESALRAFEHGVKEKIEYNSNGDEPYFRYMAPLRIEQECLKCHGFQGYKVGDVRGGISVSIPMQEELEVSMANRMRAVSIGLIVYLVVILLLIAAVRRIVGRPLHGLMQAASHIGADGFSAVDVQPRADEIGSLYSTLVASDRTIRTHWQELKDAARDMDEKSRTDALTGIYNRHHLYLEGPKLFAQSARDNLPVCTLLIDIDHFKKINDTWGHQIGDEALKLMAESVQRQVRQYDLFVRYGGEEFLLLMPNTTLEHGMQLAERIRLTIAQSQLPVAEGQSVELRVSIGLCCAHEITLDQAIIHADSALYCAKQDGRNQVSVYCSEE